MISDYIGINYDIHNNNGVNCWALVAMVYLYELETDIPDFKSVTDNVKDISAVFTAAFATGEHGFKKVDTPENYDVAVFARDTAWGRHCHCGVWYDGKVLHASKDSCGVAYQDIKQASHGFKEIEFWRR